MQTTTASDPQATTLYLGPYYRRSPFFRATVRSGCQAFDVYNHMLLPSYYGDPVEEYWHLLEHVTLWDVGVERIIEISGPDAARFTDHLTCRDLTRCAVGQGKYAPLIAPDGGIINDPVLLRLGDSRFWLCRADSAAGRGARGAAHGSPFDVESGEPDVHPVQVQGPKSRHLVEDLFGPEVRDLRYYWCEETHLEDIPVVVSRTGWTGEVGYEIYLRDSSRGEEMWDRLMTAGEPYELRPTPPSEIRRIEAGIFNYGSDMTLEHNPFEITGLERLVELEQETDFIGREALERVARTGVDRKLVGLEIDEASEIWISEPLPAFHDGAEVGRVTAATWSPRLERGIGYVWVPIALAQPGTQLRVEMPDGTSSTAKTASLPFHDPHKRIPAA
jgi:glycine cleavage system aminomethyltransferase T